MELLMGSLKAALTGKGEPEEQAGEEQKHRAGLKELSVIAAKVTAILAVSFIVARVSFFYVMYPCGLALLTVLMARGRGAIYALPPVLIGIVSAQGTSSLAIGGAAAVLASGILFFLLKHREISLTSRALLAAGICVVGKTAVNIALHTLYNYDGFSVLGEGLLVLFFVFIFEGCFSLAEKENPTQPVAANIFVLIIVGLLLIGGITPQTVGVLSPMNAAALFFVLLTGYKLGVMEGATSGVAAGLMLFGAANQGPAIMGILACGGMAAGLIRGEKRLYAATCFCAVCLSFGFLKGYPNLYMSVYEPVLASVVFLAMPGTFLEKADQLLARAGRDDAYYELLEKNRILSVLDEYRETFSYLALVYGPGKDGRRIAKRPGGKKEERSGRSVASYQFAGMACAVDGMMKELRHVEHPILVKEERFKVKLATAGYARCEGISGDSTMCNHIRRGEYLLALADGMGKGEKAAQESSLTLNTLYNLMRAGFEPELALRMINSLLLMKSTEEIFSTVDMGLINLYTGRLRLFKIGAATTFIKRGDKVEALKASSLPLGMVEKISVDSIEVSLRRGDQIIIVSDGITEADRGRICTADLLAERQAVGASVRTDSFGAANKTDSLAPVKKNRATVVTADFARAAARTACKETAAQTACKSTAPGMADQEAWTWTETGAGAGLEAVKAAQAGNEEREEKEDRWDTCPEKTMVFGEEDKIDFGAALRELAEQNAQADRTVRAKAKRDRAQAERTADRLHAEREQEDAEALAERIKIRNFGGQHSPAESPSGMVRRDLHEDWLKETIAQIKSTDPQTISDLIMNRAVERCGLKERDDMTIVTALIE